MGKQTISNKHHTISKDLNKHKRESQASDESKDEETTKSSDRFILPSPNKHLSSKHSNSNLAYGTNRDLKYSKGPTITNKPPNDTKSHSGIFNSFATILEGSLKNKLESIQRHNQSESGPVTSKEKQTLNHGNHRCKETTVSSLIESSGKCEMNYYQPNYLPSSGKNVPNNIPKAGASSNGMYKDKLEQQTIISQQVKIYLKPAFSQGVVNKDAYKTIMKKCVEKVYEKSKTETVSVERVKRLVEAYITQERKNKIRADLALKS